MGSKKITLLLFLVLAIVVPRVFELDAFRTADEKRWLSNTSNFIINLAHGDWDHLMLRPHPGITTQWFASMAIFSDSWAVTKLPLVLAVAVLIGFTGYVLWRLAGKRTAFGATLLLAVNPLLIAHSRVLAMDALLAHFLVLSICLLLLWGKCGARRYLFFAGLASAAAMLSKMPEVIILPFGLGLILYLSKRDHGGFSWVRTGGKNILVWILALSLGLVLILPSLALNTEQVLSDMYLWLQSDDYQLHQMGPWYYSRTLFFFTTPLHFVLLLTVPFFLFKKAGSRESRFYILVFLLFAILFTVMMSVGTKKGDRYILPVFVSLDVAAGFMLAYIFSLSGRSWKLITAKLSIGGLLLMQVSHLFVLQPHYLSYVNPLTQPFFGERRHGWGEGLDLAAEWLNDLPDAKNLTVASLYPKEFEVNFIGKTMPVHQHDQAKVDYVVIYRAMFERGSKAWETDVVNQYRDQQPEKVVSIGGLPMVWIFAR